jgi:DNA-binding transcriptional regulator YdaS (Cro superfamily)
LRTFRGSFRIGPGDLAMLGCFLFGPRWQTALAREIGVSPRQMRRWKSGERRVSVRCSLRIVELARERHRRRLRAIDDRYRDMAGSLLSKEARQALL